MGSVHVRSSSRFPQDQNSWSKAWILRPTCTTLVKGTTDNAFSYFEYKNGIFLLNIFGNNIASPRISQIGDAEKQVFIFPQLL